MNKSKTYNDNSSKYSSKERIIRKEKGTEGLLQVQYAGFEELKITEYDSARKTSRVPLLEYITKIYIFKTRIIVLMMKVLSKFFLTTHFTCFLYTFIETLWQFPKITGIFSKKNNKILSSDYKIYFQWWKQSFPIETEMEAYATQ